MVSDTIIKSVALLRWDDRSVVECQTTNRFAEEEGSVCHDASAKIRIIVYQSLAVCSKCNWNTIPRFGNVVFQKWVFNNHCMDYLDWTLLLMSPPPFKTAPFLAVALIAWLTLVDPLDKHWVSFFIVKLVNCSGTWQSLRVWYMTFTVDHLRKLRLIYLYLNYRL